MTLVEMDAEPTAITEPGLRPDKLTMGMFFLLSMAVFQRFIGLFRNVIFCRLLDEHDLGLWSLGFSFLLLISPISVLGLPGVFGRYVETYRQRGQLRTFLVRLLSVSYLSLCGCVAVLWWWGPTWSRLVFDSVEQSRLMMTIAISLPVVVTFNVVVELLTALRQVRCVSWMQFTNSFIFTVFGVGLPALTPLRAEGVVLAYAMGCFFGSVCGILVCPTKLWWPTDSSSLSQRDLWSKVVPFAAWVWVNSLLINLADCVDRYMLLHCSSLEPIAAQALVGNYHSARVLPTLLVTFGAVIGSSILPYLSHDWEAGRRDAVSRRLVLVLKVVAVMFTTCGAFILIGAPYLFRWVLAGRYTDGLSLMPWTTACCIWTALSLIALFYLSCAENTKLIAIAVVCGIVVNATTNYYLVPQLGLDGVVIATSCGNVTTLLLMLIINYRQGMRLDIGVCLAMFLPGAAILGGWIALAVCAAFVIIGWFSGWLLSSEDTQRVINGIDHYARKLGGK